MYTWDLPLQTSFSYLHGIAIALAYHKQVEYNIVSVPSKSVYSYALAYYKQVKYCVCTE